MMEFAFDGLNQKHNKCKYKKLIKNICIENIDQKVFKRLIPNDHVTWKYSVHFIQNMCINKKLETCRNM